MLRCGSEVRYLPVAHLCANICSYPGGAAPVPAEAWRLRSCRLLKALPVSLDGEREEGPPVSLGTDGLFHVVSLGPMSLSLEPQHFFDVTRVNPAAPGCDGFCVGRGGRCVTCWSGLSTCVKQASSSGSARRAYQQLGANDTRTREMALGVRGSRFLDIGIEPGKARLWTARGTTQEH